jgi:hypothetical protein
MQSYKLRRDRRHGNRTRTEISGKKQNRGGQWLAEKKVSDTLCLPQALARGQLFDNMVGDPEKYLGISVRMMDLSD